MTANRSSPTTTLRQRVRAGAPARTRLYRDGVCASDDFPAGPVARRERIKRELRRRAGRIRVLLLVFALLLPLLADTL